MTLDQLLILTRIADTGSVLAAAESINRTQPTVSVALKNLEAELDLDLLDRSSYRARLTPEGELLCKKARAIIAEVDEFKTLAHYLSVGHEAELHLAIEAACPMSLVLQILKSSEDKYPQTEFNLEIENIWGALDKLQSGKVDLAISPWYQDIPQLETISLTKTRLMVVATPGFFPQGKELNVDLVKNYVQIVVKDSGLKQHDQRGGVIEDGRHWQVSDHVTKKSLIVAGMGWGRLQEHLIEQELKEGSLVPLQIQNYPSVTEIDIRAVRRYGEIVGPVADALWQDLAALNSNRARSAQADGSE